jgi:hypothetical protein
MLCEKTKERGSPDNYREIFPGRSKKQGSHCENSTKREKCSREQNEQKMERCPDHVRVQQDFLLQVLK